MERLLEIKNLHVTFQTSTAKTLALRNISFHIGAGETVALVGESGCGKSVTAAAILGLIPTPPGHIEKGEIWLHNKNILNLSLKEQEKIRGKSIGMIFQDPMTSLNPTLTIGTQIGEGIRRHQNATFKKTRQETLELLQLVQIPNPEKRIDQYPHELSGGMRQRVMIAIALACKPELIIADEPTTALDVTVQAQILFLLKEIQKKMGTSLLLITHDLSIVATTCTRVLVMYAGEIIENASVDSLFQAPQHPYTKGLLASIPRLDRDKQEKLIPIPGQPPILSSTPKGCPFHPRCPVAMRICTQQSPPQHLVNPTHQVLCWYPEKEKQVL